MIVTTPTGTSRPGSACAAWKRLAGAAIFALAHALAIASEAPATPAPAPRNDAATVTASYGDTRLLRPSAILTPLKAGEAVRSGDRVITGSDGRVELRFLDGAVMAIQPGSDFKVEAYQYDAAGERNFMALARGALRTISGAIGKRNRDDYKLTTPTATIGIRGTEYEAAETPCGQAGCAPGDRPGLTVRVFQGRVAVSNGTGTTEVPEGQTLYVRTAAAPASFGSGDPPAVPQAPAPVPRRVAPPAGDGGGGGPGAGGGNGANGVTGSSGGGTVARAGDPVLQGPPAAAAGHPPARRDRAARHGPGVGLGGNGRLVEHAPALY
ncbi:MAG: FecR domain-containing protein [Burkholderiaceae bacterium]